jgi:drug/metabolite transporter (DMT)-like permease
LGAQDWLVLGALGFFQLGTGNLLIFAAVRRISAAEAGLLGIMGAVFAPTWAFLALHEVPAPLTLVGGSVILTAAALHLAWSIARPGAASAPRP